MLQNSDVFFWELIPQLPWNARRGKPCYNRSMPKRAGADMTICRNFCTYFTPGKSEDLACQGFLVVHSIIRSGRKLPLSRPERPAVPSGRTSAALRKRVCGACSFREQDCDFIASGGRAPSCGGLGLLAHLLGSGELKLSEIKGPARKHRQQG